MGVLTFIVGLTSFFQSAIRLGMTFLFGSTGETITEKSGHLNLGIPGVMCVGAACGCLSESIYYKAVDGNLNKIIAVLLPVVCALLGAALMGLLFSFITVTLRANQNVTGLALTTFGVGVSDFLIAQVKAEAYTFTNASSIFTASLPYQDWIAKLGEIPEWLGTLLKWIGDIFLSHGIMNYLAIVIALSTSYILKKTRVGLYLRAVGESPATADAAGINVTKYRYLATCIGCGIAGLGGLSFIMDYLNGNWEYIIDSIGWLCIALVIFTVWRPNVGIIGSIIFGALYILSSYIDGIDLAKNELFKMLPYLVTVIVLIFTSIRNKKENQPPQSLGLSYFREDR